MTDTTLNRFLASGTAAERAAFTPDPPTPASGPDPVYLWFETDTGDTYAWDGSWNQVNSAAAPAWGDITGTLTDQTDLDTALDAKAATTYVDTQDAATLADANDYTDAAIAAVQGSGEGAPLNGIVSGLGVAYTGSLGFAMSAGSYYLDGDLLTASAQTVTLDAADATHPRIDVLYVNASGTFGKITGTPAASPSQPAIDPLTQLYLTFVLVPATATDLNTGITTETIYDEGAEWTATTSGSGFTVDSTNNPNTGTKCIEGTTVASGAYVKFVDGSPTAFGGDGNLLLSIRSKASWNAKRSLTLQFYASGVATGSAVTLKEGSFGFSSANTTTYQGLVISKALFAIAAGATVDELRIMAAGTGGSAIGFYIDPVKLQTTGTTTGGGTGGVTGITQEQADARYLRLSGGTLSGDLIVPAETYGGGWNGSNEVPTKNDVYDKIEAVVAGGTYTDEMAQDAVGGIFVDSSTIDFTYSDATPSITASVIASAVKPTESLIIACSDETTAITTGTAKVTFRMPYAFTLSAVRASVTTAPTGSTIIIDINEGGATILSTKLSIDASEKTSTTAASAAVISDTSLADDAEITIDFDQVGSTIAGAGVKVYLIGTRT